MNDDFEYVPLPVELEHPIRILGFQCEKCSVNVVVTGRTEPHGQKARDEIRAQAERAHAIDSCKVRARD
jgi:hypothetical protein